MPHRHAMLKAVCLVALAAMPASAATPCTPCGGILPTVITPFRCSGEGVDIASLEKQIQYQLACGVHGLLVLGTMGEGQYVTWEERRTVIATAVRLAFPKVPVVVGIHTGDVDEAARQMELARELGASAVLVKLTGNPRASFDEVHSFYWQLADASVLPIVMYYYPAQTHVHLRPREIAAILAHPNIVGIKESLLNLGAVQRHIRACRGMGKTFFSSTALNLSQFLDIGGHGAMCPEAAMLPSQVVQAYSACASGRVAEARDIQKYLFELTPILRTQWTSPTLSRIVLMAAQDRKMFVPMTDDQPQAQIKYALNLLGIPTLPLVKAPLPPLTERGAKAVNKAVSRLLTIDWLGVGMGRSRVPALAPAADKDWGGLLRTGALQLGPGVGRDLLRSQGDGLWGFPIGGRSIDP
ncbi:MAG: hypothetical protein KatS3mg105_1319 [Gemmatales bacterium]|nr:MAG: hypothetical protein KatS3mg105_1319 [Gemmatales bacterium]